MNVAVSQKRVKPSIIKFVYIILIIACVMTGLLLIYNGLYKKVTPYEAVLNYSINNNNEYKVNYIDTDVVGNPDKELTDTYINSLIKNINANFNYEYIMDQIGQVTYDYSIIGNLVYEYTANTELADADVRKKEYVFVDTIKTTTNDVSALRFDKDITIDFPSINQEVIDFREKTKLPVSANMTVTMKVNIHVLTGNEEVVNTSESSIVIPFNTLAFSIKQNIPKEVKDTRKVYKDIEEPNAYSAIVGFSLLGVAVIIFGLNFSFLFNIVKKSKYEADLDRVLKTNKDIIVTLKTPIDEYGLRVVHVKDFNELLDIEEELRIPINFYEVIPNQECEFTIINNDVIYKYVYMSDDRI